MAPSPSPSPSILRKIPDLAGRGLGYNGPTLERPIYRFLHIAFALGLAHALFLLAQEGVRAHQLAQEEARLRAELRRAEARVAELRALLSAAQDPAHLEALARRLGMVRREEILKRR